MNLLKINFKIIDTKYNKEKLVHANCIESAIAQLSQKWYDRSLNSGTINIQTSAGCGQLIVT